MLKKYSKASVAAIAGTRHIIHRNEVLLSAVDMCKVVIEERSFLKIICLLFRGVHYCDVAANDSNGKHNQCNPK